MVVCKSCDLLINWEDAIINSNTLLGGLLLSNNLLQSVGTCEITRSFATVQLLLIFELTNNCIDATAADELAVSLSNCTCLKQQIIDCLWW